MDTPIRSFNASPRRRAAALTTLALAAAAGLIGPQLAEAQIARMGVSNPLVGMAIRGNAVGYDGIHGMYLMMGGNPIVQGVCVNTSGIPVSGVITAMGNPGLFGSFPRVKFSPQSPDGAGGTGAFLVSWVQTDAPGATAVHTRLVSCAPSVLNVITADALVSDYQQGGAYYDVGGSAIAYSRTSMRFLIVFKTLFAGIQARFVDANGNPIGGVMPIANPGGSQYPGVAWNPATDEFGISYSGFGGSTACGSAPFVGFVRLRAGDGFLFPRTIFGCAAGTYFTDVAVNSNTGRFVMGWSPGGGVLFQEFDAAGTGTGNSGLMSGSFGGNDNFSLDFNPVSGTFLGVGQHNASYEIAGIEANTSGFPIGVAAQLTSGGASPGSYHPTVTGRNDAAQWGISYARQFNALTDQIIGTASTGGGPSGPAPAPAPTPTPAPAPTGGCTTPNPFAAMGAGVCVNGGWQFGTPAPAPTPTPTPTPTPAPSAGCSTPNPFAAFGMGVCVNGGWVFAAPATAPPPPAPAPTPTPAPLPAPAPTGCTTSNPFAAFGMGVCVNGGWIFAPPTTPAPAPAPSNTDGSCATPDPFGGGGTCFQGGWYPPGTPTLCSGLPDPFTAFGGGICVNGGWRMRTEDD